MRVNRRAFIVGSTLGAAFGCTRSETPRQTRTKPIELEVLFEGLCGVVHRDSLRASDVLLVDAARTQTLANVIHTPRLLTNPANIKSAPAHQIEDKGEKRAFWDLHGYKVTLVSGATSGTTRARDLRRPGEEKLPNVDQRSFADVTWLAQMSRIANTGQGKIDAGNLADDQKPDKVASRVRFRGGQFKARFDKPYHSIHWRIGTATPTFEQAIGELMLSQSIGAESVTFRLEPFGSGNALEIVLAPAAGSAGPLSVGIENMPKESHCEGDDPKILKHFRAFYELLASSPDASTLPVPECTSNNCRDCMSHQEEPVYCPPTEYNP